ncbi:hypothetical protein FRC19_003648, partial [Serendipita sp. 401]
YISLLQSLVPVLSRQYIWSAVEGGSIHALDHYCLNITRDIVLPHSSVSNSPLTQKGGLSRNWFGRRFGSMIRCLIVPFAEYVDPKSANESI